MTQATNILETVTNMLLVVSLMQNPVILCTWADKQASKQPSLWWNVTYFNQWIGRG